MLTAIVSVVLVGVAAFAIWLYSALKRYKG